MVSALKNKILLFSTWQGTFAQTFPYSVYICSLFIIQLFIFLSELEGKHLDSLKGGTTEMIIRKLEKCPFRIMIE